MPVMHKQIRIPLELHRALKLAATTRNCSLSDLTERILADALGVQPTRKGASKARPQVERKPRKVQIAVHATNHARAEDVGLGDVGPEHSEGYDPDSPETWVR